VSLEACKLFHPACPAIDTNPLELVAEPDGNDEIAIGSAPNGENGGAGIMLLHGSGSFGGRYRLLSDKPSGIP
jgi:hypothetical protein